MTDANTNSIEKPPESGPTYRIVTRYWPRIAAGLVVLIGVLEWVVGSLTSDTSLEFYVFAWASITAGVWFLFEKAEKALSEERRMTVVQKLQTTDFRSAVHTIPDQFALLFDRVFGEKHLSWRCFWRSGLASYAAVVILACLGGFSSYPIMLERIQTLGPGWSLRTQVFATYVGIAFNLFYFSTLFNLIPDYLSLLQTRWAIRWMSLRGKIPLVLFLDFLATGLIFLVWFSLLGGTSDVGFFQGFLNVGGSLSGMAPNQQEGHWMLAFLRIFFFSTFFTSVWLWLYAVAVFLSRSLVKMGGGVGFLLKITDVEKQPFRSMGFTSVVIVSVLFLVGLPFVLLG